MEMILIIGHGSRSKEASNIEVIAKSVHARLYTDCDNNCVRTAYLQFNEPAISEAIKSAVNDGADRIIIHPYFLSSGVHVKKSIPEIIRQAEKTYPDVEFICTKPLAPHDKLTEIVLERVEAAGKKRE